jgi:hypothetical protein
VNNFVCTLNSRTAQGYKPVANFDFPNQQPTEFIMSSLYTRQEVYDLLWAKPKKEVAADLGISDYHLLKACREHSIPIPRSATGRARLLVSQPSDDRCHPGSRVIQTRSTYLAPAGRGSTH